MSPTASLRPCAGGCGARVTSGRCPSCATQVERRRGSASERGYGAAWEGFRPQFIASLVDAGIPPVCGAALPGGPVTTDSTCKARGLLTFQNQDGSNLHLDHEPPLAPHERKNPSAICDPMRIQLLCRVDHAAKTKREASRRGATIPTNTGGGGFT